MSQYVLLIKLTPEGARAHTEGLTAAVEDMRTAMGALGGDMTVLMTLGEYDLIATGQAPSDEHLAWFVSQLASTGNVRVTTMKAFAPDEWRQAETIVPPDIVPPMAFK